MTYQANVFIKHNLKDDQKIMAYRPLPNGTRKPTEIAKDKEEQVPLVENRESLTIQLPDSTKNKKICFNFCTKVNLQATYYRSKKELTIEFLDTDLNRVETPTTVNVTVGDENP